MRKSTCAILSLLLLFTACEKEIDLPYRSVDPLYVIEGKINNEGTEVFLSRTLDMDSGITGSGVPGAIVTLTGDDGTVQVLDYVTGGYYRPSGGLTGNTGTTYTLKVEAEGQVFTSTSCMNNAADLHDMYFRWLEIINERMLFCTFSFRDIPGEDNYYCYRVRRNSENYRWHVLNDKGADGDILTVDIFCMAEKTAKDNKKEDWKDILYEGDSIEIELQTIDRRTYDYLFSLGLSERTSANPIDNFEGGCLGYFAAYSSARTRTVFSYDDVM